MENELQEGIPQFFCITHFHNRRRTHMNQGRFLLIPHHYKFFSIFPYNMYLHLFQNNHIQDSATPHMIQPPISLKKGACTLHIVYNMLLPMALLNSPAHNIHNLAKD